MRECGDDRQFAGKAGKRELVATNALLAHAMGREHGHDELAGAQPGLDLVVPFLARADLPPVAPDVEAQEREIGLEPFGQVLGVGAAVAEEKADLVR